MGKEMENSTVTTTIIVGDLDPNSSIDKSELEKMINKVEAVDKNLYIP